RFSRGWSSDVCSSDLPQGVDQREGPAVVIGFGAVEEHRFVFGGDRQGKELAVDRKIELRRGVDERFDARGRRQLQEEGAGVRERSDERRVGRGRGTRW